MADDQFVDYVEGDGQDEEHLEESEPVSADGRLKSFAEEEGGFPYTDYQQQAEAVA